jgi:hypothetical protein
MKFKKPQHYRTKLFVDQSFSSSLSYDPPSAGLRCEPARAARVKTARASSSMRRSILIGQSELRPV